MPPIFRAMVLEKEKSTNKEKVLGTLSKARLRLFIKMDF